MIDQHDVTKQQKKTLLDVEHKVRLLDMEGVYHDNDEYVLLQRFVNGEIDGEIAIEKADIDELIQGLEWARDNQRDP